MSSLMNTIRKTVFNMYKNPFVAIYTVFMINMIKRYVKPNNCGVFIEFILRTITTLLILSPLIFTIAVIYCIFKYCDNSIMIINNKNKEKALYDIELKLTDISYCAHEQLYNAIKSDETMPKNDKSQFILKFGKRLDDTIDDTITNYIENNTNSSYGIYDFSEFIETVYSNVMTVHEFEPIYYEDNKRVFTQYVYKCDGHDYTKGRFEIYRMFELVNIEEDVQIYVCHREEDEDNENDFVLIVEHYNPDLAMKLYDVKDVVVDDENYGFGVAFGKYSKSITFGEEIDDTVCFIGKIDMVTESFSHILNIIQ